MKLCIPQIKAKGVLLAWGRMRFMYGHAVFYVGVLQLILVAMMAYNTTVRDWAHQYLGIDLSFWQYALFLAIGIGIGFLIEYMISIPALIAVSNEQMYKHDSPIKTDFEDVKSELKAIREELAKLREEHKK